MTHRPIFTKADQDEHQRRMAEMDRKLILSEIPPRGLPRLAWRIRSGLARIFGGWR